MRKTKLLSWGTTDWHQGDLSQDSLSQKQFYKRLNMQLCLDHGTPVPKDTTRYQYHNADVSTGDFLFKLELGPQLFLMQQDRRVELRSRVMGFIMGKKTTTKH